MPRLYSIRPTWSLKGRRSQGLRGFTGKPFHPPLTDFPIVCYSLAALFDLISYFSDASDPKAHDFFAAATFVMVAGYVVSMGAALTGFMDWWKGIPRDRKSGPIGKAKHTQVWRTINFHATVMIVVTVETLIDILQRVPNFDEGQTQPLWLVLSLISAAGVLFGAGVRWDARVRVRLQRRERGGGLEGVRGGSHPSPARRLLVVGVSMAADRPLGYRTQTSVTSAASPQIVYDTIADLRNDPDWSGERASSETFKLLSMEAPKGPAAVGTAFTSSGSADNGTFHDRSEVTVASGPTTFVHSRPILTSIASEGSPGMLTSSTGTTSRPRQGTPRITYTETIERVSYVPYWLKPGCARSSRST